MKILGNENTTLSRKDLKERREKLESLFSEMLDVMGFNYSEDPNMQGTPRRMAKMYMNELFTGCFSKAPKFTVFPNTKKVDEMVYLRNIKVTSMCSHHFMPFIGVAHIAYVPDKKVCGVSKLSRVVRHFARRPQIQEELTAQILVYLQEALQPKGIMCIIEAQHMCMSVRGVNEPETSMGTSRISGVFKKDEVRQEFLSLLKH